MKSRAILLAGLLALAASASQFAAQVGMGGPRPTRLLPDLKVSLVSVKGNKAIVRVQNVCKGDAPASKLAIFVYNGANKSSGQGANRSLDVPPLAGSLSNKLGKSSADVAVEFQPGTTLEGKFIRGEVDRFNAVKESSEGNNWFEKGEGAAQPFPEKAGYCDGDAGEFPTPSFKLKSASDTAGGASYTFSVAGWESVSENWFLENAPTSAQCGGVQHGARMIARLYRVNSSGGAQEAGCGPFYKNDLGNLTLTVPGIISDSSRVKLVLEDRLFKTKFSSPAFDVEPFVVLKGLNALGCKTLLGNPNSFVCTTDSGFKSCEDLRKAGKPIKCTRAGQK